MSLAALIPIIGPAVEKLLSLIPDPNARAKAEAEYQKAMLDAMLAEGKDQREINKAEASHSSVFVAGWRPAIGWVCASALAFQYIVRPLVLFFRPDAPLITLDDSLWQLVFGMLGVGTLRTIEKAKGLTR